MTDGSEVVLLFATAPDEEVAARVARTLVDERLIACANLVPQVRSVYRWQGQVHDEREAMVLLKTSRRQVEAVKARFGVLHPAEVPELIAVPVNDGLPAYLQWVLAETSR